MLSRPILTTYRDRLAHPRYRNLRLEIFNFYRVFARLTAYFVDFDIRTLRRALTTDALRISDLASPPYIQALGILSRRDEFNSQSPGHNMDAAFRYGDEITEILAMFQNFHSNQGGSMAHLAKLGQLHSELISRFPRLCDHLGYISCLMANLTRESSELFKYGARYNLPEVEKCKASIARAYQYFGTMSGALSSIIDKHVNYLSQESASSQLESLTEIYTICLTTDRTVPADIVLQHRKAHLPIADQAVPEAMAYYWRFTVLSRLIMSTQMQLRVMASSTMCNDLVGFWKRHHSLMDDASTAFLKYLADFLLRSGLVAYILGPTCHPEITMESSNIVGFLLVSDTYTQEQTDLLWQTVTSSQDPRVSEGLIRMTGRIANLFQYDHMVYICQKLDTLAVEAFSPTIRELCAQIFGFLKAKVSDTPLDISPYVLCSRLARESSVLGSRSPVAYPDLLEFSTQHFKDLLTCGPDPDGRRDILLQCMQDIGSKSPTSLGSLAIMSHLLSGSLHHRELRVFASENDLVRLLIDEMEAAVAAACAAGFPAVISGTYNTPRRDMIKFIVHTEPLSITAELGRKLWNLLVGSGAACRDDRDVGWQILNHRIVRPQSVVPLTNAFISTCFEEYLPTLPSECFCAGTLEFVRSNILPLVNDVNSIVLDDFEGSGQGGIEQLWRMILTAPSHSLASQAIRILVNDIYVESRSIMSFPPYRARKVHLTVADRCLRQLSCSASKLRQFTNGTTSGDDLEPMVVVVDDQQIQEQELLFVRSLAVLRELHHLHQASTHFSVPDLSSLILDSPAKNEGDSADLKFQSFDQGVESEVDVLPIGRQNTVGSLLAIIREATGFSNYRIFFRGQPFLPQESDASKTLEQLHITDGVMLVKREPDVTLSSPQQVRSGASPLENRILAHFEELHGYLSMDEKLAREIYTFLVKLPPDENIVRAFTTAEARYTELFPIGQPFKSLYAVYALEQCLVMHREPRPGSYEMGRQEPGQPAGENEDYPAALRRGMSLIVAAIADKEVLGQCPSAELRTLLGKHLVQCLVDIIRDPLLPEAAWKLLDALLLERLVTLCSSPASASSSATETEYFWLCLEVMLESCSRSAIFWSAFCNHEGAIELLKRALLLDPRAAVRHHLASIIRQKVTADDQPGVTTADAFASFFWPLAFELTEAAMEHPPGTSELFSICSSILKRLLAAEPVAVQANGLFSDLSARLFSYTTYEDMTRPEVVDDVASGLIGLMHDIAITADSPIDQPRFPERAFWKLLFPPFETETDIDESTDVLEMPKPILCTSSRQKLIDIILKLVDGSQNQLQGLLDMLGALVPYYGDDGLSPLVEQDQHESILTRIPGEPYAYDLGTQFERSKTVRASCGYAGMKNLSNTCYLNSLVTQLFMNVRFRSFMLNAEITGQDEQALLFQTRKLFGFMQESLRRAVNPEDCVLSIKTYEEGQIDIHNQMDVDEFYNLLFDRWESQLKDAPARKEFRTFYGGQLMQQIRSNECEHISERLEPFSAIQCDIKGKTCLQESLQAYVDGEIMEGDNKYLCGTCDKHVNAVKRACLKDIPDNLIFHLKRFDFSVKTMQRSKINDHFAFPTHMDMRPYTVDYLRDPGQDHGEDVFVLVGVLVHSGTAESGHYYSYVRERPRSREEDVWVEFNDDTVSPWDPANMENACFGGVDFRAPYDGNVVYDKSWSAYMLFYQRASSLQEEQELADRQGERGPLKANIPEDLRRHIQYDNVSLLRRHCLYDPSQIGFVITALNGLDRVGPVHPADLPVLEKSAIDVALGHMDQVASRTKDVPAFGPLYRKIQDMVQTRPLCSVFVYEHFDARRGAFRALLQRNPEVGVRSASSSLLVEAAQQIKELFPALYGRMSDNEEDFAERGLVLHGMMRIFQVLFDYFHTSLRSWPEVFGFMVDYLRLGRDELATFLKHSFFESLILIICADGALDLGQQYARLAAAVSRKVRPPSYEKIIDLISMAMNVISNETDARGQVIVVDEPRSRIDGADACGPFYLWESEFRALIRDWAGAAHNRPNVFIEKLITINQNDDSTFRAVEDYMRLGRAFEDRVFRTLKANIFGEVPNQVAHFNTPFLRIASLVFCHNARDPAKIRELINHVTYQCKRLEHAEGMEFVEFQKGVFDGDHANTSESRDDVVEQGFKRLPEWAPYLLGYYDLDVGREVESFIYDILFAPDAVEEFMDCRDQERIGRARLMCRRELGRRCLMYLRDKYVVNRAHAPRPLVSCFERVISHSQDYYSRDDEGDDSMTADFFRLHRRKSNVAD
jgi:ubiquitin carboxyl-terminal hydrolase 34